MTLALSPALKLARSNATKAAIDGTSQPGKIDLYSGTRPAAGVAQAGSLCASITLSRPCGTVAANGLSMTAPAPAQATLAGIITWARVTDQTGAYMMDGDVRMSGDADVAIADFIIDVAQVYPGSFINLVSALLAEGG